MRVGNSTEELTDELVICTLDRPDEVVRCLDSVARQTRLPTSVRVVDASTDGATRTAVESYGVETVRERLIHQHAERGLTRQRNAGVRSGHSDIVHFVDDDCVLDPHYLEAIVSLFEADEPGELLGVGGMIVNLSHGRAPLTKRLFMLDSDRPGHVLPSGRNQPAVALASPVDVDWLSGCSMSLRREVFGLQAFDERFEGYGLGEDVEFTYRLRQRGRLVVTPAARIEHLQSERNRLAMSRYTYDEIVNRSMRVRERTGRLRMRWYWWSVIGQLGGLALISAVRPGGVERERLHSGLLAVRTVLRNASLEDLPRRIMTGRSGCPGPRG